MDMNESIANRVRQILRDQIEEQRDGGVLVGGRNPWMYHLNMVRQQHPSLSLKDAMQVAKESYDGGVLVGGSKAVWQKCVKKYGPVLASKLYDKKSDKCFEGKKAINRLKKQKLDKKKLEKYIMKIDEIVGKEKLVKPRKKRGMTIYDECRKKWKGIPMDLREKDYYVSLKEKSKKDLPYNFENRCHEIKPEVLEEVAKREAEKEAKRKPKKGGYYLY